ncbi:MAG: beta-propeller domain-containing protein [Candidatus Hadarchaeales archaeon]
MREWLLSLLFAVSIIAGMIAAASGAELLGIMIAFCLPVAGWLVLERKRTTPTLALAFILVSSIAVAASLPLVRFEGGESGTPTFIGLKSFSSYQEIQEYIESRWGSTGWNGPYKIFSEIGAPMNLESASERGYEFVIGGEGSGAGTGGRDFSTTNIQVLGVDEADIVKCDGTYIYVVSGENIFIISAYPPEDAELLSNIEAEYPVEIYVNGDMLAVIGWDYLRVYDISDRRSPRLERDVKFENGYYYNSRMVGDYVYLIINSPIYVIYPVEGGEPGEWIKLPVISCNWSPREIRPEEIYYFEDEKGFPSEFVTIMAVNLKNRWEDVRTKTFLMSSAQNIFVSLTNLYITYTVYENEEKTAVHRISIGGGKIEYAAGGEVPGTVLNQFSMDEHEGYFRVATTKGDVWSGTSVNNVYVLDGMMNVVGRLENLAPGERIYSVRFMGDRAYMVTYVRVDPLFVLDLSNPSSPGVLGELKIPGYSDYLHPYDEAHIIGVGKETTTNEQGFEISLGVKIALFDVSDPENPLEISKYVIGERGTDSLALYDHRAFLFRRHRNLLSIPIGDWWGRQEAYIFHISLENGIVLRGTIGHGEYQVKRILYIEDVLYTVSDAILKMNEMDDLDEIGEVKLPTSAEPLPLYKWVE